MWLPIMTRLRGGGVRIKHRLGKNSIKLYDKAWSENGTVQRPEGTLNAPGQFRVFRHKTGDENGTDAKLRMLRAHGVIRKLAHTHRYHVTDNGRLLIDAILSARRRNAPLRKLQRPHGHALRDRQGKVSVFNEAALRGLGADRRMSLLRNTRKLWPPNRGWTGEFLWYLAPRPATLALLRIFGGA